MRLGHAITVLAVSVGVAGIAGYSFSDDLVAVKTTGTSKRSASKSPTLSTPFGEMKIFPGDNIWNQRIDHLPVHPNSSGYLGVIGNSTPLHPDWGSEWKGQPIGMPITVVRGDQRRVPIRFEYADESDPGFYPIPEDLRIEGGPKSDGDRHALILDYDNNKLFELYNVHKTKLGWTASSGAIFDLASNAPRPIRWTSADAAGLPILPGLVRYDEVVEKKQINHALRFTVKRSQNAFIYPARHCASSSNNKNHMPMGLRLRLKNDFDISKFPESSQVILKALKQYGMILADNGSDLFMSGEHDPRWNSDDLAAVKRVTASDLEVVYTGEAVR